MQSSPFSKVGYTYNPCGWSRYITRHQPCAAGHFIRLALERESKTPHILDQDSPDEEQLAHENLLEDFEFPASRYLPLDSGPQPSVICV